MPHPRQSGNFHLCLHGQRGAVLMIMLVIVVLGAATYLVSSLSTTALKNARQEKTAAALAQAKDALIGYAISYGDTHAGEVHGYLPCPDVDAGNGEGSSNPPCGSKNISSIGRLPWRTLGLSTLRDGDGECLWYAVSGTYKNNPKTDLMNWDTNGKLQAFSSDGALITSSDNQAVAVIFAPGATQSGQNRSGTSAPVCGGNYTVTNYLDNDTAHSINNSDIATGKFIQPHEHRDINGNVILSINDKMLFITRQDIWNAVQKRTDFQSNLQLLTRRVAECLADYGRHNSNPNNPDNKSLPWPASLALSDYGVNDNYDDVNNLYSGRIPYIAGDSNSTTHNTMTGNILMDNNGLVCPYYSAIPSTELQRLYPWWDNWKDHLFYVLSKEYRPQSSDTIACGNCVKINGSGSYAAVVMFSGSGLPGLARASTTTNNSERGVLSNYLEGRNFTNHPNSGGNGNYQTQNSSSAFNDTLYCINENLSVIPCPTP